MSPSFSSFPSVRDVKLIAFFVLVRFFRSEEEEDESEGEGSSIEEEDDDMDEERRGVTLHDNEVPQSYEHEQAAANAQAQAGAPIQMGSNGYPVSFDPLLASSFFDASSLFSSHADSFVFLSLPSSVRSRRSPSPITRPLLPTSLRPREPATTSSSVTLRPPLLLKLLLEALESTRPSERTDRSTTPTPFRRRDCSE